MRVIPGQVLDVAGHVLRGIGQPDGEPCLLQPPPDALEAFVKFTVWYTLFSIIDSKFTHFRLSPHNSPPSRRWPAFLSNSNQASWKHPFQEAPPPGTSRLL